MRISNILSRSLIIPSLAATDKPTALREISTFTAAAGASSPNAIYNAVYNREQHGSTGVGQGVAIPHAKLPQLHELVACFGISHSGIPYDSIDKKPVNLIFMLLVPEASGGAHLKALARVSRLLRTSSFREELLTLRTADCIYEAFLAQDEKI